MDQQIIEELRRLARRAGELGVLLAYWADRAENDAARKEDRAYRRVKSTLPTTTNTSGKP